jgi:hypothetical protein
MRAATFSIRLRRCEGGDMRISHVLWMTVMGRRRTTASAPLLLVWLLPLWLLLLGEEGWWWLWWGDRGAKRLAAGGGNGDRGPLRLGEMLLDVVARRSGEGRADVGAGDDVVAAGSTGGAGDGGEGLGLDAGVVKASSSSVNGDGGCEVVGFSGAVLGIEGDGSVVTLGAAETRGELEVEPGSE